MSKIGIYGGTFDPIHIGHLIIAEQTREILNLNKIIFLPNGNPPHKTSIKSDKVHRLNMIKKAIENNENFEVSDLETRKEGVIYTYDTIIEFKKIYSDDIYFIMGEDSLINLNKWYRYQDLVNICKFVVIPRIVSEKNINNIDYMKKYIKEELKASLEQFLILNFPILDISSTIIRKNIAQKKSVKYLLPEKVIKYIYEEKLYEG